MFTVYFLVIVLEGSQGFGGITHIPQTKEQCEINARNINTKAVKLVKYYNEHTRTATCIIGALPK